MRKPKLKIVTLERWDCGIEDHNHLTEVVAIKCIARQNKSEDESDNNEREYKKRLLIIRDILNGKGRNEIIKENGKSYGWLNYIIHKTQRKIRYRNREFDLDIQSLPDMVRSKEKWLKAIENELKSFKI